MEALCVLPEDLNLRCVPAAGTQLALGITGLLSLLVRPGKPRGVSGDGLRSNYEK